ncbi:hypothetical protein HH310_10960 [Actinoplanes sp. TBRC 11911]|uniref:hypothetical protein n=1 Tax=Actinoplanes sp. TBRC 11911 TaxID=2729386 RepID=UPI00145E4358|nr:hypothetical protein [Actinoplanes sp. TBRC 11911]NMO51709.1 hypothetical protein [Actinoplanes sp. TBRC 11911]
MLIDKPMPPAVRAGSLLLAGCSLTALGMSVSTVAAWPRFGPVADFVLIGAVESVLTLVFGWLAFAVRVPRRRWAQIATWVVAFAGGGFLLFNLVTGLYEELAPGWYPDLNAILGLVALVLMIAGALSLARSDVLDYYREASWQFDDRWTYFIAGQNKRDES